MVEENDTLVHYGVKRRSGRYPWGSGDDPYQHSGDFLARVEELTKDGKMTETQVAKELGLSTTELRISLRTAKHERRQLLADKARSLRDDGKSLNEIAAELGFKNDSSVRALLDRGTYERKNRAQLAADKLKEELKEKHMIDVGAGAEREMGISTSVMSEATFLLENEGYHIYGVGIPQVENPRHQTVTTVLTEPDITYAHVYNHMGDIQSLGNYHSTDGGKSYEHIEFPASIDSSRIFVRYADKGGISKDGTIELRRGVPDLDLGPSHYAQVRILVDGDKYIKGMALYSDNIPDGYDILINSNKPSGTPMNKVLKEVKRDINGNVDAVNPFGAALRAGGQSKYIGADGKEHLSAINKLKQEGDWDTMARMLSAQFLAKQPLPLIRKQLGATYADLRAEYEEIQNCTNPTVKRKLLYDFADTVDSHSIHMKAASLPRQSTQVILPVDALKPNEVYAPNYKQGEHLVLVRYPHGGIFEIPELVVNNKNKAARSILGTDIKDAIGINSKTAEQLSGADFDGDFVTVIPVNERVHIKTAPPLEGLKGFEPRLEYAERPGMRYMKKSMVQKQMGMASNLITDMTLRGATPEELTRAVKHSMVVIDAYKHKLDYIQSEKDNGILELRQKYQKRVDEDGYEKYGGASTLLSKKKQTVRVPERQGSPRIDPETGELIYKESGRWYKDKKGNMHQALTEVPLMSTVKDAHSLSTGTKQEEIYADYANKLKALANEVRKEYINTRPIRKNPSAAITYAEEVKQLKAALDIALRNAPKERRAQAIANSVVKAQIQANPDMEKKDIKKASHIALINARASVGAGGKDSRIELDERKWEAIQAGAVSNDTLEKILRYSNPDVVRKFSMPKPKNEFSDAKKSKIRHMLNSGYTNAEIAEALGVSVSSIINYDQSN